MTKKMASLDNDNLVVNIIIAPDWELETPTLRNFTKDSYVAIGFTYDETRDAFIPPQPYASWVLDEDTCLWEAPIAYPAEGDYVWDEEAGDWVTADETV